MFCILILLPLWSQSSTGCYQTFSFYRSGKACEMSLEATARPYSAGELPQSSVLKFRSESFLLNSFFICIGDILCLHFYVNVKEYKTVKWEVIWENTISVYMVVMQLPSQLMPVPLVTCLAHQSLVASAVILSASSQYYYLVVFFNTATHVPASEI